MSTRDLIYNGFNIDELKTKILPFRSQEKIMNSWLEKRLDTILPKVMKRNNIDCWIVCCREYNEDPTFLSLVPKGMMSARRKTILAFFLEGEKVVRYSLTRPGVGLDGYYNAAWTNQVGSVWSDGEIDSYGNPRETQYECLKRLVIKHNPSSIGLNYSEHFAFGDGISYKLYSEITNALGDYKTRVVSADKVAVGWLETRIEEELAAYTGIVQIAHALIAEAFSSRVIIPGVTTNHDVKYYMLQKVIDLGLTPWFNFTVDITREKEGICYEEKVIMPGDLLHCDVGLKYLGLCTDTQENAYILKIDEEKAPQGILDALKACNELEDIVVNNYAINKTGNQVLKESLKNAINNGLHPCIYTHPIGVHGHGAGPIIGLWDKQDGVEGTGDYPLHDNTLYSLELNNKYTIREWNNQEITLSLETDIMFKDGQVYYVAGRQTELHYIK